MNIHITMTSGGHFKVTDPEQAERFYHQWTNEKGPLLVFRVAGWEMQLRRDCIEALSIAHPDEGSLVQPDISGH